MCVCIYIYMCLQVRNWTPSLAVRGWMIEPRFFSPRKRYKNRGSRPGIVSKKQPRIFGKATSGAFANFDELGVSRVFFLVLPWKHDFSRRIPVVSGPPIEKRTKKRNFTTHTCVLSVGFGCVRPRTVFVDVSVLGGLSLVYFHVLLLLFSSSSFFFFFLILPSSSFFLRLPSSFLILLLFIYLVYLFLPFSLHPFSLIIYHIFHLLFTFFFLLIFFLIQLFILFIFKFFFIC